MKIKLKTIKSSNKKSKRVNIRIQSVRDAVSSNVEKPPKAAPVSISLPTPSAPPRHFPGIYRRLALAFAVLTIILLTAIIYFSFTEAEILIFSKKEPVSIAFLLNIETGQIQKKSFEQTKNFEASKSHTFEEKAKGIVTIINNFSKEQPLIATTRLLSREGTLFRTKKSIVVPANGRIEVQVQADKPGKEGEILPTTFTIPGLWVGLQDKIYGQSSVVMTGGISTIKTVSKEDLENAKNSLSTELSQKALSELEQSFGKPAITFTEIKKASSDVKEGAEQNSFSYTISLDIIGIFFEPDKILDLAKSKLQESITLPNRELAKISEKTLAYFLEDYNPKENTAVLKVYLEGESQLSPSSTILSKEKFIGLNRQEAEKYFKDFSEIEKVEVQLYPFWTRKLPLDPSQITLEIK